MKYVLIFLAVISCSTITETEGLPEPARALGSADTVWTAVDSLYLNYFPIMAHGLVFDGDFMALRSSPYIAEHQGQRITFQRYWTIKDPQPRIQYCREESYIGLEEEDNLFIIRYYKLH